MYAFVTFDNFVTKEDIVDYEHMNVMMNVPRNHESTFHTDRNHDDNVKVDDTTNGIQNWVILDSSVQNNA